MAGARRRAPIAFHLLLGLAVQAGWAAVGSASPATAMAATRFVLAQAAPAPAAKPAEEPRHLPVDGMGYTLPPADLLLSREGERSAEAMAHFIQGLLYEEQAESSKMVGEFLQALDLDPGYTPLAEKVAYELIRQNDVPGGIGVLKDAAKADPSNPRPYLHLATIYYRNLNKLDLATSYAAKAIKADPSSALAYQTLYEIHMADGQKSKARAVLETAAKLETKDPEFWIRLGELYARLLIKEDGSTPQADLNKVSEFYGKALAGAGDDLTVLNAVADYFVYSRQVKRAIPLYLKILQLRPRSADSLLSKVGEKLARSFLLSGDRQEAIAVLEDMVRRDPMKYETYEFLAQLYEEGGDLDRALTNYEQCLLLSPNQPLHCLRVGDLYLQTGKFGRAVQVFEEGRAKFPDLPYMTYSLAIAYSKDGRHELGLRMFEQALNESEGSGSEIVNGNFYFNYGVAAEAAGQFDRAVALFKKSIELDPTNAAQALNYLGYMLVEKGERLDEAEKFIKRALELDPENGAYIDSLGWLYFKKGLFGKALGELLRAADLISPADPVVFDHIGDTYQKLGKTAQALIYWQKAVTLDPENKAIAAKIENAKEKVSARENTGDTTPAPVAPDVEPGE